MEIILLIIYSIIVWFIFFKKKWLPWNITSQVIVVTIPIIALAIIILFMNIVAPSSSDVRAMNYVIPIVPRVTGQVTEVPIEPNRPIKKGDVLFKIDPVPFEAAVKAAEATLRGVKDQLKNATAKKAALTPRIDLAKKRVEQFTALAATGAGKRADLEQAQSDLGNLESEFLAADATESQAESADRQGRSGPHECEIRPRGHDASRAGQRPRGESRAASRRARDAVCDHAGDEFYRGGRSVGAGLLSPERIALCESRATKRKSS